MTKLKQSIILFLEFLILLITLRPNQKKSVRKGPFFKVLAKPSFLGGPMTKFWQIEPLCAKRFDTYSAVFCFSGVYTPIVFLKILKFFGAKIIVNQNGVYYPAWFKKDWKKKNRYLKNLNDLSDHSFFQSEFAVKSYEKWVGRLPREYSVLHNGVDLKKFKPSEQKQNPTKVLFFTDISEFTYPFWKYVLEFRDWLSEQDENNELDWVYCGRILNKAVFERLKLGTQRYPAENYFNLSQEKIAEILPSCGVALHLVYNDVCPNKVLEEMASGVWVIGLSAGGTPELIGNGGKVLEVRQGYENAELPEFKIIKKALDECFKKPEVCKKLALTRAQEFSITNWQKRVEQVLHYSFEDKKAISSQLSM